MRIVSAALLMVACAAPAARADEAHERLKAFGELLGKSSDINTIRPDGNAVTYSMVGVIDEAARIVTRLEVESDPCKIRTTEIFQKPPNWGQMSVTVTDFSKIETIDGYASFDDLSSQKNKIPVSSVKAIGFTIKGKELFCRTGYYLAEKPAEIYSTCDDRIDRWAFSEPEMKVHVLNALARVAETCNLPFLKP